MEKNSVVIKKIQSTVRRASTSGQIAMWEHIFALAQQGGSEIIIEQSLLNGAVEYGDVAMVEHILHRAEERDITLPIETEFLSLAISRGHIGMLDYLLNLAQENGHLDQNQIVQLLQTTLYYQGPYKMELDTSIKDHIELIILPKLLSENSITPRSP